MTSEDLTVERVLAERVGLNPASLGAALIERAVDRRKAALGSLSEGHYARLVSRSRDELQALIEDLVVTESWFYRDVAPFGLLRQHAQEGWIDDPGRPPLRVLSVPCAAGEEPYSIALALLELGLPGDRFRIDAVDLSLDAIARAREATYRESSLREVPPGVRRRWFRPKGDRLELVAEARAQVQFRQGNLLELDRAEPPLARSYDVVFCRNVLIYFHESARALALEGLGRLLGPGGLLFLGHAETFAPGRSPFELHPERGSFAYRRRPARSEDEETGEWPPVGPRSPGPKDVALGQRTVPEPGAWALPLGPPSPNGGTGATRSTVPLLDEADRRANLGDYKAAAELCRRAISEEGPSARAFHLWGTIHQALGDLREAEEGHRKAVYLDGRHEDALLALSLLARRQGDLSRAEDLRRRAERVRSRKEPSS